jgi:hypothetical protein
MWFVTGSCCDSDEQSFTEQLHKSFSSQPVRGWSSGLGHMHANNSGGDHHQKRWLDSRKGNGLTLFINLHLHKVSRGGTSSSKLKNYINKNFPKPQLYHLDFWPGSLYVTSRKDTTRHDVWRTRRSSLIQFLAQFRLQQKFSSGTKSNTIQSQIANLLDFSWHFIMK